MSRWPMVAIGEVADPVDRFEAPLPGVAYRQIGVRLWGEGAYERESIDGAETKYKMLNRVVADDIIVNKIWARNGSVSVVTQNLEGCFCSGEFPLFRTRPERLDPQWFYWITKTRWFWEACDCQSRGTSGKNRLRPQRFLEIAIPLAPIEEQRRVVEKLNRLAANHRALVGLTTDSRSKTVALGGSVTERAFDSLDCEWRTIDCIGEVRGGIQRTPARAPSGNPVRYLTVAHVHRDHVSTADPRYFEVSASELERFRLAAGDVLIIEGNGSASEIGRCALFRGEIEPCVHQNHVIRIRPAERLVDPEYLSMFLNSSTGQREVQRESRTSSGLRTLSVGRIKRIRVPVPPMTAQLGLVDGMKRWQVREASLQDVVSAARAEVDVIMSSALLRVFGGADPDSESIERVEVESAGP